MADIEIDCVTRPLQDSRHDTISDVGGPNPSGNGRWKKPVKEIVLNIDRKIHKYYVLIGNKKVYIETRINQEKQKYIQAYNNGIWTNEILLIKSCK